jgi:hypothetical protein
MRLQLATIGQLLCLQARCLERIEIQVVIIDALMHAVLLATDLMIRTTGS